MPSITFWTRLEPSTRLEDIDEGLQAKIHDPLWLLARQWQTGEFQGEDAATPVQARVRMVHLPLTRFHAGPLTDGAPFAGEPYRAEVPLETLIEREAVQVADDPRRDLRLAAEAGLMFLRLLDRAGAPAAVRAAFAQEPAYALSAPPDDPAAGQDPDGQRYLALVAGRLPDGFKLYDAFRRALGPAADGELPPQPVLAEDDRPAALAAARAYVDWYESQYSVPSGSGAPAWVSSRMEYAFAVAAAIEDGEVVLSAPEYPGGTVDWYSFDIDFNHSTTPSTDPVLPLLTRTVIPAPVRYPGMAAGRWWQFEDARVNFSRIEGDPDELMRLLLVQFALVYSDDWYVLPFEASFGAVYNLDSLVVTDAFGVRTLVPRVPETSEGSPDWRMYAVSPSDDLLFLPPVLASTLSGDPIEEVTISRDELANLVWAVERRVPSLAGGSFDRAAMHRRTDSPTSSAPPDAGALRYRLATTVPEHWIPFRPVRPDPARPDIRLRRAAALLDDAEPGLSRPLGRILQPDQEELSLFEEEVPRSGVRIVRRYKHTRWVDGSTILWLARQKDVGTGETSSGLRFDVVEG